jgi:lysophospholipase L1-like esterase
MEDYFLMCQPAQDLKAMNHGWSGQWARDFATRMGNDTLPYKPTVATTCFGMNDGAYGPLTDANAQGYRENTKKVIDGLKAAGVRFIVIGSNGAVDTTTFNRNGVNAEIYNKTLGQLRDVAREVAAQDGVAFADVYAPMLDVMAKAKSKYGSAYHVAGPDGIHPRSNGHMVMAYAFLKGLGCSGDIGTITVAVGAEKAQATGKHKILSAKKGSVEIESSQYPFCFAGDPTNVDSTSGIIEFFPFNQDLNRFTLIVTGADTSRLKVTWGKTSKEFTAEQLAKGINLAAEFMDNPFSEQFAKVDQAVRKQQAYETPMIKSFVHNVPQFKGMVNAAGQEALENVVRSMNHEREDLASAADKLVVPVKHTIQIEKVQ